MCRVISRYVESHVERIVHERSAHEGLAARRFLDVIVKVDFLQNLQQLVRDLRTSDPTIADTTS
jgi:hypothetical protein